MAGTGISGQIGVVAEESYGTFKAPSRFYRFESESLTRNQQYIKNQALGAGLFVQAENLHRATTRDATGDISIKLFDQGMGRLFNMLHGNTVTPTKVVEKSEEVYKQVHAIGLTKPTGKSLTIQVGRDDGTVQPFSYVGCKIVSFGLSLDNQGEAVLSVGVDGRDEKLGEALAAASYDADTLPFTFQQWELKLGGSKVTNARSFNLSTPLPMATDRYNIGSSGLKSEPLVNAFSEMTGDAELEFSLADHERFVDEEVVKLEFIGTGAEIGEEGEKFVCKFTAPAVKQVTSAPTIGGPDLIMQSASFEVLYNGTDAPMTIEYLSTDSAL